MLCYYLSGSNQFTKASVNISVKNMPAGEPPRRIGIDQLTVNFLRYIKVFISVAIGKRYFKYLCLIFKIKNSRVGSCMAVFRCGLAKCFRGNTHQKVIGLYNSFTFFFGG